MSRRFYFYAGGRLAIGLAAILALLVPLGGEAQSTGRIEFVATVTATGGRPEPVRQMTFYLLRKSLKEIRAEAQQSEPGPDLNKFVDGLSGSPEMKAWMKKHHSVQLSGPDFAKSLTADEIVDTPEFFKAYLSRNVGYKGIGFPDPKFTEKEKAKNPAKYDQEKKEFLDAVRKFIKTMPESVQGIDVDLIDVNPAEKWQALVDRQQSAQDAAVMQLIQQRYLAAQADSDLDGRGAFAVAAPGTYWMSMLGGEAISGDVRLHWDVPVTVRFGETTRVELSNLNAVRPDSAAQALNR